MFFPPCFGRVEDSKKFFSNYLLRKKILAEGFIMAEVSLDDIEKVLDEKIRPALALHGGDILLDRLEDGVLYVKMIGQCSGCPSAEVELEETVDAELTQDFPDIRKVAMVTGVSDELIAQARDIMALRHQTQ